MIAAFKKNSWLIFLFGALVGGVLVFGMFTVSGRADITKLRDGKSGSVPTVDAATAEYTSERFGFSLQYPRELIIKEFDDGGGSGTVVFQKPGEPVGFQVYVTPHAKNTIDGETILRDVPSGIVIDLQEEQLRDDLLAATFWSEAPLVGRSKEVWFLHDGYLFEFTGYASFDGADEWLKTIVKTISFNSLQKTK